MTLMILSGVAANLPDILTGPYAILKKDILFSRKIAEFQHLIQNHVSAFFGYSLQLVFLGIIISFFILSILTSLTFLYISNNVFPSLYIP